jgi:hypothetical protein
MPLERKIPVVYTKSHTLKGVALDLPVPGTSYDSHAVKWWRYPQEMVAYALKKLKMGSNLNNSLRLFMFWSIFIVKKRRAPKKVKLFQCPPKVIFFFLFYLPAQRISFSLLSSSSSVTAGISTVTFVPAETMLFISTPYFSP